MPDNYESIGEHFLVENVFLTILKYFPFYVIVSFPPVQSNIALLSAKNVSLFLCFGFCTSENKFSYLVHFDHLLNES